MQWISVSYLNGHVVVDNMRHWPKRVPDDGETQLICKTGDFVSNFLGFINRCTAQELLSQKKRIHAFPERCILNVERKGPIFSIRQ